MSPSNWLVELERHLDEDEVCFPLPGGTGRKRVVIPARKASARPWYSSPNRVKSTSWATATDDTVARPTWLSGIR
jgi:hypothetical protein